MNPRLSNLRIVAGAQKSGTTSLYHHFGGHPDVRVSKKKETKFFAWDKLYEKGIDFYLSEFYPDAEEGDVLLDTDPSLLFYPGCAERIWESAGDNVRILIILRNPAVRAYSHWVMEGFLGHEDMDFDEAVRNEQERIKTPEGMNCHSYITRGKYTRQMERYLDVFPAHCLKVMIFEEDFIVDAAKALEEICAFFEVPYSPEYFNFGLKKNPARRVKHKFIDKITREGVIDLKPLKRFKIYNKISKLVRSSLHSANLSYDIPRLTPNERDALISTYFMDDIGQLEELIDRDLSVWKPAGS